MEIGIREELDMSTKGKEVQLVEMMNDKSEGYKKGVGGNEEDGKSKEEAVERMEMG